MYLLYEHRIVISRHVIFHDDIFHFHHVTTPIDYSFDFSVTLSCPDHLMILLWTDVPLCRHLFQSHLRWDLLFQSHMCYILQNWLQILFQVRLLAGRHELVIVQLISLIFGATMWFILLSLVYIRLIIFYLVIDYILHTSLISIHMIH